MGGSFADGKTEQDFWLLTSNPSLFRHLLQNSSMTLDTVSDLTRDILELADNDITDKVGH